MTTRTIAPLTDRLREATAAAHEEAEHSGFMSDLLDGKLDVGAVGALAGPVLGDGVELVVRVLGHPWSPRCRRSLATSIGSCSRAAEPSAYAWPEAQRYAPVARCSPT